MKTLVYNPSNVCSRKFEIDYEDGKILALRVEGGCHGNLQGISSLLKGMDIEEAKSKLAGIICRGSRNKQTSCPDQIAKALTTITD